MFLGYRLTQPLLYFTTVSYAFWNRVAKEAIEGLVRWTLEESAQTDYVSPEVVFVDGTHIKASENFKKHVKNSIAKTTKH